MDHCKQDRGRPSTRLAFVRCPDQQSPKRPLLLASGKDLTAVSSELFAKPAALITPNFLKVVMYNYLHVQCHKYNYLLNTSLVQAHQTAGERSTCALTRVISVTTVGTW